MTTGQNGKARREPNNFALKKKNQVIIIHTPALKCLGHKTLEN